MAADGHDLNRGIVVNGQLACPPYCCGRPRAEYLDIFVIYIYILLYICTYVN